MPTISELSAYSTRLATFDGPVQVSKRRASAATKKKTATSVEWPHADPTPEQLALAGFYYKPSATEPDNVACWLCNKNLANWESGDEPAIEHINHVSDCAWAINVGMKARKEKGQEPEDDPMSDTLLEARRSTFADLWPHEKKRGWKAKTEKMIAAGFSYNPTDPGDDYVTCYYCDLALDGWEPKDDPRKEHIDRNPNCDFFRLTEAFAKQKTATKKSKRTTTRTSRVSRSSRLSTQSAAADPPDDVSTMQIDTAEDDEIGDSTVLSTDSTISRAGRSRKKTTRAKGPAKKNTRTGKKDAVNADESIFDQSDEADADISLASNISVQTTDKRAPRRKNARSKDDAMNQSMVEESIVEPKPKRKGGRAAKEAPEESIIGLTDADNSTIEPDPKLKRKTTRATKKTSKKATEDVSTLDGSIIETKPTRNARELKNNVRSTEKTEDDEVEVEVETKSAAQRGRGKKRYSDGTEKADDSIIIMRKQSPIANQPAAAASDAQDQNRETEDACDDEPQLEADTVVTPEAAKQIPEIPDINAQVKVSARASAASEEASKHRVESTSPPRKTRHADTPPESPNDQSSDAENVPPSSRRQLMQQNRVPLRDHTNLASTSQVTLSPSKRNLISGGLVSREPWHAIDLDSVFLASPNIKLGGILGSLTSPEKTMTVEQWIVSNAGQSEQRLRDECERMICNFESEGVKALRTLEGISE